MVLILFWSFVASSILFFLFGFGSSFARPSQAGRNVRDHWIVFGLQLRRISATQAACVLAGVVALCCLAGLIFAGEVGLT